ncbi:MAG: bifunctional oligoribonuclease/PAP phosphatase NrnA [Oscillospiraceae bacterium]|nr:bifunctional oligoribonuclease/PAP phosphatase NrnA [Oscillospiraceae bacterium]
MTLDKIVEEIGKAENIVILTHDIPDGDAIGSSLALYLGLTQLNKNVDLIIPEFPDTFNFLPGIDEIKKESENEPYDLAIALDCGDIKRLNGFVKYFEDADVKIQIDHHKVNTMFGDYNFVDPTAPSCSQVLIVVLESLGIEITKEIGTCLLTGIITDTGGFKYQGVTPETFEFTAGLLTRGVNVSSIYKKVMQTVSKARFELTKRAMNRLEFLEDGKISFTYITEQDKNETNAGINDHDGIVEMARDIEGVEVSIFLREQEEGYKISLRSNEYINVADICLMFSGGGHLRAAGGEISLPFDQAKEKILSECKRHLK